MPDAAPSPQTLTVNRRELAFDATPDYALVARCLRAALAQAAATGRSLQRAFPAYKEVRWLPQMHLLLLRLLP